MSVYNNLWKSRIKHAMLLLLILFIGLICQKTTYVSASEQTSSSQKVTATLISNSQGTANQKLTLTVGQVYGNLPVLTQANYTFSGWFTESIGGVQILNTTIVTQTSDFVLYAHWTGNASTISFQPAGGTVTAASKTVYYGQPVGDMPVPVRTGFLFDGWLTASGALVSKEDTVRWQSAQTLYASWKIVTPKITFQANGGTMTYNNATVEKYSITSSYGTTIQTLPIPVRPGYQFAGWFTEESSGARILAGTVNTFAKDTTLYAQWTANPYSVMFYASGGTVSIASKTVTFGAVYGSLPTPVRENFQFIGWYLEADYKTKVTAESTMETAGNHTLFALWEGNSVVVTFDAAGGKSGTKTKKLTYQDEYGTLPVPRRTGYTFQGWYTASTGGNVITENSIVNSSTAFTVYARWTEVLPTITFDANGGSVLVTSKSVHYKNTYGDLPVPTRTGYIFTGWYTTKSGTKQISAGTLVNSSRDIILYAHWKGQQLQVTFDTNGGVLQSSSLLVTCGEKYGTLPSIQRSGYTFAGWYTSKTAGSKITADSKVEATGNHTLYAMWNEDNYTVHFYTSMGTVTPKEITVFGTTPFSSFPTPVCEGYSFTGWFTKQTQDGTKVSFVTAESSLYAHWQGETYTITLNTTGGTLASPYYLVQYGGTYGSLPEPVRTNYTFAGWYTKVTGGRRINNNTKVKTAGNHTLYAHWKAKAYTLTYDANGGTSTKSTKQIYYGEKFGALKTISASGLEFLGWYTSATGGTLVTSDSIVTIAGNQTVYAHWQTKQPTIRFLANGGYLYTGSSKNTFIKINKEYGKAYGALPVPVRTGYSFQGWYTTKSGTEKITQESICKVKETQTLYAHWKAVTSTVTFDMNGGSASKGSITVTYGNKYGTLPEPTRYGHTFIGWYTEDEKGSRISSNSRVKTEENSTLFARWAAETYAVTLDGNGGKCEITSDNGKTVTAGSTKLTLPYGSTYGALFDKGTFFVRDGYYFLGWFSDAVGGTQVTPEMDFTVNKSQTLYAHWLKK